MKIKKILLIIILFFVFFIVFNSSCYAKTQEWNSLNYDVTLNSDGDMDVVETWNIYISETNTLFKDFNLDLTEFSDISYVKVSEVTENGEEFLNKINTPQYHVDSNCYYGLQVDSSTFEIAWNVGLDNSSDTRTYKIYYTVKDAVKVYNDCTELYWKFLGTENTIPGKNVTGTIKLPKPVNNIEKLRVWAHGDLSGEIKKISNNEVGFKLPNLSSGSMLEIRIVTEENIYEQNDNIYEENKLNTILQEEQQWADEANAKRKNIQLIIAGIIFLNIIITIFFLFKIKKYVRKGKELKIYSYPKSDLKYFRDIPDEKNATPARAAYLFYFVKYDSAIDLAKSQIFSATILNLALKNLVEFEPLNKKDVKIILKENINSENLTEDEEIIYELLKNACDKNNFITTKEFSSYAKKNYEKFYKEIDKISSVVKKYEEQTKNIDVDRRNISREWNFKAAFYTVIIIISVILAPLIVFIPTYYIGMVICSILSYKNAGKISILSEKGNEERNEWKALKNYMDDFSLLKEKEVPDLILWEKFLVYATAFGISKKVIEQLKVVYPEIMNESTYTSDYRFLYMASSSNFGDNFINTLDSSLNSVYKSASNAYSAAHSSSSGSGGGGGFSSGGGGRRWRRPVAVDVN